MNSFTSSNPTRRSTRKRGSVLIIVVSLLVMLAMMGTAYIATARLDRVNTAAAGVRVKMEFPWLDDQAREIERLIVEDVLPQVVVSPAAPDFRATNQPTLYTHMDSPGPDPTNTTYAFDPWIADRIPSLMAGGTHANRPYWRNVSLRPNVVYRNLQTNAQIFDATPAAYGSDTHLPYGLPMGTPGNRTILLPTSIVLDATHTNGTPVVMPAFQIVDDAAGTDVGLPFLAADADGDGIADSMLYQIPGASIPGWMVDEDPNAPVKGPATVWVGVRVIDNNSAINASVAWTAASDFSPSTGLASNPLGGIYTPVTTQNFGMFQSHVGLQELLSTPALAAGATPGTPANELLSWNQFRFPNFPISGQAFSDTGGGLGYTYNTVGEALFMGLTRRLTNPGRSFSGPTDKFGAVSGDERYLGYRFGLIDPTKNSNPMLMTITAPAKIEQKFASVPLSSTPGPTSVYTLAMNWVKKSQNQWTQYPANRAQYWYGYNFNYTSVPLAATTELDLTPSVAPATVAGSIRPLIVTTNPTSNTIMSKRGTGAAYSIPAGATAGMTPYPASLTPRPTQMPTKVSINTALFGDLWRGFWNVMSNDVGDAAPAGSGSIFSGGGMVGAGDMWLLRSAIAAANAYDLRDTDDVPTYHDIRINGTDYRVYGTEAQPYISAMTMDASGDGSVTLYNPRPTPLAIAGGDWYLVKFQAGTLTPLAAVPASPGVPPGATVGPIPVTGIAGPGAKVLLMRRARDGTTGTLAGGTTYADWSPVDSVIGIPAASAATYARDVSLPWKSVFPGAWGAAPAVPYTQVQVANVDFGGPNKGLTTFPFGGFPRLGDILQVTFIGSYRVGTSTDYVSTSEDTNYADDGIANDTYEQVGRFCPLYAVQGDPALIPSDTYGWADKLFDYFTTIQNQNDDYLPNAPPPSPPTVDTRIPIANGVGAAPNGGSEDTSNSTQGLLNINTAGIEALSQVPFTNDPAINGQIALAIVNYRIANGPFKSLFQLNLVTEFRLRSPAGPDPSTIDPDVNAGDFTPLGGGDGVVGDFEARFQQLTNVSNLLTVRSDSYTVYIVVQAWKNAGAGAAIEPTFVAQRRAAFVVDRSQVSPAAPNPAVTNIEY